MCGLELFMHLCLFTMSDVPLPFWLKIAALYFIASRFSQTHPPHHSYGESDEVFPQHHNQEGRVEQEGQDSAWPR